MLDLRNCDCMDLLYDLPEKSQHLIIVDPPYFEVKGGFDFIWPSFDAYLSDVRRWATGVKRAMADNGTLLWWGHAKKIAYTQIILDEFFSLESSLVWRKKDSMQYQYYSADLSRTFNSHNERLLMYSNDHEPTEWAMTGTERIIEEHIKPRHPFALYLRDEFKAANISNKVISALFPSRTGGLTGCVSNWLNGDNVPTPEQYETIRRFLGVGYLRKEYEELRKEYEELRRPFNNSMKLEDVLEFSQEAHLTGRWDHPTQKPPTLCRALIQTCSKRGQNLLVPFAGSFVEVVEGVNLGLNVTASELDPSYYARGLERVTEQTAQTSLF